MTSLGNNYNILNIFLRNEKEYGQFCLMDSEVKDVEELKPTGLPARVVLVFSWIWTDLLMTMIEKAIMWLARWT